MIGCADRVVYIGQSNQLSQRSIDSLGRVYHRIPDTALPWSIAFAPFAYEDMDEHESAAIRAYAPEFNTSIPSMNKSLGRMPVIAGTAQIFADQASRRRRAQRRSAPTQRPERITTYVEHKGVKIHIDEKRSNEVGERHLFFEWMAKSYGKVIASGTEPDKATAANREIDAAEEHLALPYRFKINLRDDGSVVTRDGEYLGTWKTDENGYPSFTPDGESEVLFFEMWIGMLCQKIADWHEAQDQVQTS